jgi:hypothetical protein
MAHTKIRKDDRKREISAGVDLDAVPQAHDFRIRVEREFDVEFLLTGVVRADQLLAFVL